MAFVGLLLWQVTSSDCARLELDEDDCALLVNVTQRRRDQLDTNDDGRISRNDLRVVRDAIADLNVTLA